MLFLWFILILTVREKWLSMYNRNLDDCIHIYSLFHCALGILASGKHFNQRDEYGIEFPAMSQVLHFHGTEKAIKLAKKVK